MLLDLPRGNDTSQASEEETTQYDQAFEAHLVDGMESRCLRATSSYFHGLIFNPVPGHVFTIYVVELFCKKAIHLGTFITSFHEE